MSVIEFEPVYRTDWSLEDEKTRYESDKEWEGNSSFFYSIVYSSLQVLYENIS